MSRPVENPHLATYTEFEVLYEASAEGDRSEKMPIYAAAGVPHAWLLDPLEQTLEVYVLGSSGQWSQPTVYSGAVQVRAVPFDAIELDMVMLAWELTPAGCARSPSTP